MPDVDGRLTVNLVKTVNVVFPRQELANGVSRLRSSRVQQRPVWSPNAYLNRHQRNNYLLNVGRREASLKLVLLNGSQSHPSRSVNWFSFTNFNYRAKGIR